MVLTCRSNFPRDFISPQTKIQQDISSLLKPLKWNYFMEGDSAVVSIVIFRMFIQQGARTINPVSLFTHPEFTFFTSFFTISTLVQTTIISLLDQPNQCLTRLSPVCLPTICYLHSTWNVTFLLKTTSGFFPLHLELNPDSISWPLPSASLLHYAPVIMSLFWLLRQN